MAEESVGQLAETVGTPVERLLLQIDEAGLPQRAADDVIKEAEKEILLAFLKKSHGEDEGKPRKITLKRRTLSTLKTGGSAGRGRTVNVEVRKKRTYVRRGAPDDEQEAAPAEALEENTPEAEVPAMRATASEADSEIERKRQEAAGQKLAEQAEKEQKAKEEEERKKAEEEAAKAESAKEEKPKQDETLEEKISARKDKRDRHDLDEEDLQQKKSKHGNRKRRVEELVGDVSLDDDLPIGEEPEKVEEAAPLGLSSPRTRRSNKPTKQHKFNAPTEEITREVELGETITIQQLSQKMSIKATDVIKTLFGLGIMKTINEAIDQETAMLVVEEFGHTVKTLDVDAVEKNLEDELVYEAEEAHRAPVVTVMGHVDHGKTSLLDYIRNSKVASGEAGGITQHIGAYRVATDHGEICFIDTPGHAAFTAMRARGANSTDIVILVVAADDGVMPQTEEAVLHAKGAGVPIVVAVNKIDKEGADPDRVKNELAGRDVIPEDWGGDTQFVHVSALTGEGINELLEAVSLQAELLELKAVEQGPAHGVVIESELDKGKGPVATLLVQNGTLKQGDIIVAGQFFGRARALSDENGKKAKVAGPATPVAVLGLSGTPNAGDSFIVAKDEKRAREVAKFRADKANEARLSSGTTLDSIFENFGSEEASRLNLVVKADVRGSLEAILSALHDIGNEEVMVNVVMSGVGAITESDATYAITAGAVIFGFNVRADNSAKRIIENESLDLRYYKVIYDLVDDVRAALSGMLAPEVREDIVGIAEVRDVFLSKKMGQIAGCMVIEGSVHRAKNIRVLRDNVVIYEGELESLRHFKDEVENVSSGTECGIGVRNYNDVKVGDQIEVFDTREVAREL
ncbi:MAG: translation initiation factor IF-2 [Gammaproteobacteria bacterium]|jgi:translation initiation factor IF-2|nr:translation initiation factor IF-2 [Gammaproteobacteria bacterium]